MVFWKVHFTYAHNLVVVDSYFAFHLTEKAQSSFSTTISIELQIQIAYFPNIFFNAWSILSL